jgi:hypothetical protein
MRFSLRGEAMSKEKSLVPGLDSGVCEWLGVEGVWWTSTSLTLPRGLLFDQYRVIAKKLEGGHRQCQWGLADLLHQGEGLFGERYAQISAELNLNAQYLMDLKSVAARVAPELRREGLSFGHHRAVASLEREAQKKLLDLAERNCWTREVLTAAVKQYQASLEAPPSEESDEERVFYPEGTEDHGSLVTDPLAEFDVQEIIQKVLELLEPASELEIRQVLAAIQRRYLPRRIEVEVQ